MGYSTKLGSLQIYTSITSHVFNEYLWTNIFYCILKRSQHVAFDHDVCLFAVL